MGKEVRVPIDDELYKQAKIKAIVEDIDFIQFARKLLTDALAAWVKPSKPSK